MKKYLLLGIALLLTACSHCYEGQPDLLQENWISHVATCHNQWTQCADEWFLHGEPNRLERYNNCFSDRNGVITASIRTCDFNRIYVNGNFEVQITNTPSSNSVVMYGPSKQVRQVAAEVHEGTLYLYPVKNNKISLNKVIIRIGIRNLCGLTSLGPCLIEGRQIFSDQLTIDSRGSGNILLEGSMNVTQLNQRGSGTVTVIGAKSPSLNINVYGPGNVNISGRLGIQSVTHNGNGSINIVGADTRCLEVYASGKGYTGIYGAVGLKKVTAMNRSCVLIYWVNGYDTRVFVHDKAQVGLAGSAQNLTVNTSQNGRYLGSYLHAKNAYVRSYGYSHASVTVDHKLFTQADDGASIYYFGSASEVSRYPSGNAIVLYIGNAPSVPKPGSCLLVSNCISQPPREKVITYWPAYK